MGVIRRDGIVGGLQREGQDSLVSIRAPVWILCPGEGGEAHLPHGPSHLLGCSLFGALFFALFKLDLRMLVSGAMPPAHAKADLTPRHCTSFFFHHNHSVSDCLLFGLPPTHRRPSFASA